MIGGGVNQKNYQATQKTLELKILEQKLQFTRLDHISFSISNDIAASLTMKPIGS